MNAKQAMRKAKKLAEQEAERAVEEKRKARIAVEKAKMEADYPLYSFILEMNRLEWKEDESAGEYLISHWPAVREELKTQTGPRQKLNKDEIKIRMPDGSKEDVEQLQVDFSNLMNECDMFFLNAHRYEEMIPFFRELLEMMDLSSDQLTKDNYVSAIGEAYHELGRKEERDQYFSEILAQERNDYVAAKYAGLLLWGDDEDDIAKAEKLLADYQDSKDDLMQDRLEMLKRIKREKREKGTVPNSH